MTRQQKQEHARLVFSMLTREQVRQLAVAVAEHVQNEDDSYESNEERLELNPGIENAEDMMYALDAIMASWS